MEIRSVPAGHGWDWFSEAWAIFKRHPWVWIGIFFVNIAISMGLSFVSRFGAVAAILSFVFDAGVLLAVHRSVTSGTVSVSNFFDGFKSGRVGSLLGIFGFYLLVVIAAVFLAIAVGVILVFTSPALHGISGTGGSTQELGARIAEAISGPERMGTIIRASLYLTLLGVMAVVVFMLTYLAPAVVVFEGMPAWAAMKRSYRLCAANVWPLTVFGLVYIGMFIACIFTLGLGFFILFPVLMIVRYTTYRDVIGGQVPDPVKPV